MTQQNATNELPYDDTRIYRTRLFSPMSDEKRARLNSYTATRDAILNGTQLPLVVNMDAVEMLERELVCCVVKLIRNEVTK